MSWKDIIKEDTRAKEVEQYLKGIKNKIMAWGNLKPSPFLYEAIEMLEDGVITSSSLNDILSKVRVALDNNEGMETYHELKEIETQLESLR